MNNREVKICCVIPARGGSKGIKDKNLQPVNGVPLVERATRAVSEAGFDAVHVYSDDKRILDAGSRAGAIPTIRPPEVSGDSTTTEDTVAHFIQTHDAETRYRAFAVVQCTTPFLRTGDIRACVEKFRSGNYDSVVTVTKVARYLGYPAHKGGYWVPMYPYRWLRQEYDPPFYMENGGVYLARRKWWLAGRRIGERCGIVEMDWWRSMEIDDETELDVANLLSERLDPEVYPVAGSALGVLFDSAKGGTT